MAPTLHMTVCFCPAEASVLVVAGALVVEDGLVDSGVSVALDSVVLLRIVTTGGMRVDELDSSSVVCPLP